MEGYSQGAYIYIYISALDIGVLRGAVATRLI